MLIRVHLRRSEYSPKQRFLRWAEYLLFMGGCLTLVFCGIAYFEARVYQASEARQFEEVIQSGADAIQSASLPKIESASVTVARDGSPIGMIEIPRVGISAVVVEGVTSRSLRLAAGHIPGTALPGQSGNIGIAGHRDTFFRNLRNIREQDLITIATLSGSYEYSVESAQVVDPADTQALQASSEPVLTLVTCYPFYYVGPAPRRFIVRARQTRQIIHYRPR